MKRRKKISKLLSPFGILNRLSKKATYRLLLSSTAMKCWPLLDVKVSFTSPSVMSWSPVQNGVADATPGCQAAAKPNRNRARPIAKRRLERMECLRGDLIGTSKGDTSWNEGSKAGRCVRGVKP